MESTEPLREEIISFVLDRASRNGGFIRREDLSYPAPSGPLAVIATQQGIRNPVSMDATLSVVSVPDGPYNDRAVSGGYFHYSYRKGSLDGDNKKLRRAFELQVPIILLLRTSPGEYVPIAPVYVVADRMAEREFLLALDESVRFLDPNAPEGPQRRYAERVVKQRLHQAEFRGRVISAYQTRCTICRLHHGELLDAAHITADADEAGLPVVSNGLSLCKIHHAAYDKGFLGISPDYQVHIDHALLEEVDGPMLRHGLQDMHGTKLTLPSRRADRPDQDRLQERFVKFLGRAS